MRYSEGDLILAAGHAFHERQPDDLRRVLSMLRAQNPLVAQKIEEEIDRATEGRKIR